jgi:Cu/Ag efflux protein CusF
MRVHPKSSFLLASVLFVLPIAAVAQAPAPPAAPVAPVAPVAQAVVVTVTGIITAIDYAGRIVSVQFPDKTTRTVRVSPDVTRFPALKVGDNVTFTATESVVYSIAKPGAVAPPETIVAVTGSGVKPSGGASDTTTAIVTVTAIDPAIPSITVQTNDGSLSSYKVKDVKNIAGVKVGDKIQISYNVALVISVK